MKNKSVASVVFDTANSIFMAVFILITLYPMLYVFSASISDNAMVVTGQIVLWPKNITLWAYEVLLADQSIWISYWNTIRYTVVQTVFTLIVTAMMAYPLSKRWLKGRRIILLMAAFTLLFGGGLIPTFLVVKQLGMLNSIWAIVIPTLINTWYLFIMRTFFEALPQELEDAATIDGCGTMQTLFRIIIPLSLPVMMTIGLFTAVGQWNAFFEALIYLNDNDKMPLQIKIRSLLIAGDNSQSEDGVNLTETIKYALIMISTLPILCVYPYTQKYFAQGSMIGGIKG